MKTKVLAIVLLLVSFVTSANAQGDWEGNIYIFDVLYERYSLIKVKAIEGLFSTSISNYYVTVERTFGTSSVREYMKKSFELKGIPYKSRTEYYVNADWTEYKMSDITFFDEKGIELMTDDLLALSLMISGTEKIDYNTMRGEEFMCAKILYEQGEAALKKYLNSSGLSHLRKGGNKTTKPAATPKKTTTPAKKKSVIRNIADAEISQSRVVDLGLSVKWANCNVGATSPEQYGGLYGWADATGTLIKKKLSLYPSKNPPTDICGNAAYDIARAQWGGTWRLPTEKEMKELIEKCTWLPTTYKGVKGLKVVGSNGKAIFLPFAGFRFDNILKKPAASGMNGQYWTGTLQTNKNNPYSLDISSNIWKILSYAPRYQGKSVRPVCE